mgnify:CR=1 FL=1
MEKQLICISRQYGSGGRTVGKMLAERLQIPYYDREIISMASEDSGINAALFQDAAEKALCEAVEKVAAATAPLAADRKYADLLAANDELAAPVNAFFDAVMVMDKDEKVKNNRLALLNQVKKQVNQVADLSQLVMK